MIKGPDIITKDLPTYAAPAEKSTEKTKDPKDKEKVIFENTLYDNNIVGCFSHRFQNREVSMLKKYGVDKKSLSPGSRSNSETKNY